MNISAMAGEFKAFAGECVSNRLARACRAAFSYAGGRGDGRRDVNGMLSQAELVTGSVIHET